MGGREFSGDKYRFGFHRHEKDDEIKGVTGTDYNLAGYGYDALIARRKSLDPKANKLASWSPYAFALDNPLNIIDNDGQWPTKVHHQIIENAFGKNSAIKLTDAQIVALKHGSDRADNPLRGNQKDSREYMHGMRPSKMTEGQALKAADDFVQSKVDAFVKTGDFEQLGEGLHTLMDITSPAHRDKEGRPQVYKWFKGHSHHEDPDRIAKNDGKNGYITIADMKERTEVTAVKAIQDKMKEAMQKRADYLKKQEDSKTNDKK